MINEWVEFCAYTGTVSYTASKKSEAICCERGIRNRP